MSALLDITHEKTRAAPKPTFSVIVPCWNAARTLEATLASLAAQTRDDFEAILVNDGSTDGTAEILARWAASDERFRVFNLANGGPSVARNFAAFQCARADLLAFLDADDLWAPNKLERVAEFLAARPDVDAVYARIAFFRGEPETARTTSKIVSHPLTPADLLQENRVCTMSNLVARADLYRASGGLNPAIVHGEDLEWLVGVTAQGALIEGQDEVLVYYRASDDGLSGDLMRMHEGWSRAVATAEQSGYVLDAAELRAAEAVHLRYLARRALRVRVPRFTALRLAWRGASRSPRGFFGEPWRGGMTFLGACLEPLMPYALRRLAFSL